MLREFLQRQSNITPPSIVINNRTKIVAPLKTPFNKQKSNKNGTELMKHELKNHQNENN